MLNSKNLFSVKEKTILVTGSSSDMARPLIEYLNSNGAEVIMVDKKSNQNKVNFYKYDLSKKKSVLKFSKIILKKYTKIDAIINFIGISNPKDFEYNFKVNIFSIYYLVYGILNIIKNKECSIVNITSLNAELGFKNNPGYNSSKGALKMLSKSLAVDLAKYKIRVNNVGPGYIRTKMTKKSFFNKKEKKNRLSRMLIKKYGEPDDIVGIIIFLITNGSNYVTGQDFYIDGGFLSTGI